MLRHFHNEHMTVSAHFRANLILPKKFSLYGKEM